MRVSQDKVLIMPLHNAADDKMADTSNRTRYILWSMVLVAIAVCFVCLPAAGTLGPTAYKLTLRRPEPVIQVRDDPPTSADCAAVSLALLCIIICTHSATKTDSRSRPVKTHMLQDQERRLLEESLVVK